MAYWSVLGIGVLFILVGVAASAGLTVESFPGFPGPLPFHLQTGYVDVDGKQLFYYFIESEDNPKEDPLVLWLVGGPRCSGLTGVAIENGPIYFRPGESNSDVPTVVLNPNSWTKVANIIFIDAPVDTGFSYSNAEQDSVMSDTKSAHDTYEFLRKWIMEYPQFYHNPLYISGDSYNGIIIPLIVQELIYGIENGRHPLFNFQGYTIGNPYTDPYLQTNTDIQFSRGMGLISDELYMSLQRNCKGDYFNVDPSNTECLKDLEAHSDCVSGLQKSHILEPKCPDTLESNDNGRSLASITKSDDATTCRRTNYLLLKYWANNDRVRKALHIRKGTLGKWIRCNYHGVPDTIDYGVPYDYNVQSSIAYHRNISTKGYRSLIYSGDHDRVVNRISTEAWIQLLNSSIIDDWRPWVVDGQIAGYTRTFSNGMTYATVKGGGHTAPEYKPKECLAMFKRWIRNNSL